jgi:hypothetical protein
LKILQLPLLVQPSLPELSLLRLAPLQLQLPSLSLLALALP